MPGIAHIKFVEPIKKKFGAVRAHLAASSFLAKLHTKAFQHWNIHLERGMVARAIGRLFASTIQPFKLDRKYAKLSSLKHGRALMKKMVLDSVASRANLTPEELKALEARLDKLIGNPKLKRRGLMNAMLKETEKFLHEKIAKEVSNPKEAKKLVGKIMGQIHRDVTIRTLRGIEIGKNNAILDLAGNKLYISENDVRDLVLDPSKKDAYEQTINLLKEHGFKTSGEKYARMIESKILVEAFLRSDSVKEAYELYREGIEKRMETDEAFRKGFIELMEKEVMKTYNAGSAFALTQEFFTKFPAYIVSTVSRLLAQASRRLPILGDLAAMQYEAAAAVSEIGDKMSDRIQASAYIWHSLRDNIAGSNMVKDIMSRTIEEIQKKTQVQQQVSAVPL